LDTEALPVEAPAAAPEPSFAAHEAQFSNRPKLVEARQPPETSPSAAVAAESGDSAAGEVKPPNSHTNRVKERSRSQQATADDVPTISALTKEYHDALSEAGFTVERKTGESERVFAVRQRAEMAKALRDLKRTPAAPPVSSRPSGAEPSFRPNGGDSGAIEFGDFDLPANFPPRPDPKAFADYTDYLAAESRWHARAEFTSLERQREQQTQAQAFAASVQTRYTAAKERYADFDATVLNPQANSPIPRGSVIERFTFKHVTGPDVAYHFFKHPDEVAKIHVLPDADDQIAELTLLGQRLTQKHKEPVASTRSTTPAITPIVKPPNLVRTGAVKSSDEPLGDDASLADHERVFGTTRRRR
jgi:hypothetical protein